MPSKKESEINPVLKALVDAAGEVGSVNKLKIGIILKGKTAQIIVCTDRVEYPDGGYYLGSSLEVLAAAGVVYDRASAIDTTGEIIVTALNVRLIDDGAKETPAQ